MIDRQRACVSSDRGMIHAFKHHPTHTLLPWKRNGELCIGGLVSDLCSLRGLQVSATSKKGNSPVGLDKNIPQIIQ